MRRAGQGVRLTTVISAINSLVPFAFSGFLYRQYSIKKRLFYLYWSLGFTFYGILNVTDFILDYTRVPNPVIYYIGTGASFIAFISLLTGLGQLVRKPRMLFTLSLIVPTLSIILVLLGVPSELVENITSLMFLLVTLLLYYLRMKYRLDLEIVDLGWLIILLANLGYSFQQLTLIMTIIFSLLGKTIVFLWMTQPRFVAFTDKIEFFIGSGVPRSAREKGTITILESSNNKENDLDWIVQSLKDRLLIDTRKILIITNNLFSDSELIDSGILDIPNLRVIRMNTSRSYNDPISPMRARNSANRGSTI